MNHPPSFSEYATPALTRDASVEAGPMPSLKRRNSSPGAQDGPRKRVKGDENTVDSACDRSKPEPFSLGLAEDLVTELTCGCCSGLVYRPVIVHPCQHFFCGSCCVLWIEHGGTNCPACRGISTTAVPFRAIQSVIDILSRSAPQLARSVAERQQADAIYTAGTSIRLPTPREPSPPPPLSEPTDFAQLCPHCSPDNQFGWSCPTPVPDPNSERAWPLDNGNPPGHTQCGNCESLMALNAPLSTKCDMCQVSFCGIAVHGRCVALSLQAQQPDRFADMTDLITSPEVYECFVGNAVEVEYLLDYLIAQRLTPSHIYREIIAHIRSSPRGFKPLIEDQLFSDLLPVSAGIDPDPEAPRRKICRVCASEVLIWGLRDWWIRERAKGLLPKLVNERKDCPDGVGCSRQKDLAHAKDFNHIIGARTSVEKDRPDVSDDASSSALPLATDMHPGTSHISDGTLPPPPDDGPGDSALP